MTDIENWQAEMLDINPWAREAWKLRCQLVENKVWNLSYLDQGGNTSTREWLEAFRAERRQASFQRWRQGAQAWADWATGTRRIIDAFETAGLWDTRSPGSPRIWARDGRSALANSSPSMPEYTKDFLMAIVLLLARADFSDLEIGSGADFSGHDFPAGAQFGDINVGDGANFEGCIFGDRADFAGRSTQLGMHANFQKARFQRACFTMAAIGAEANFADAVFGFGSHFEAANIGPRASFKRAQFAESASFAEAVIGDETSFGGARFGDDATFEAVTFGREVSFDDAAFEGRVAMPKPKKGQEPSFNGTKFKGPRSSRLKY